MGRQLDKQGGAKYISGILKATSKGLRQQLHLRMKVSCISNILLIVMLCTILEPNGEITNSLKGIERLDCTCVY